MRAGAHASTKAAALRRRAQSRLRLRQKAGQSAHIGSDAEVRRLVHELQVHQIELELQNEELQQAGLAAREAAEKYTELYDFAPVGYFSLDREGRITEANLASAAMLGLPRSRFVGRSFESFVPMADKPAFRTFLGQVFERGAREHREMTLKPGDREPLDVRWDLVVSESSLNCRVTMVDISAERRAEQDRLILSQLESLGVLAGGIAHDFNNLLAVILLSVEVADSLLDSSAGKVKEQLDGAMKAVFLAQGLARKFISLADGGSSLRKNVSLSGLIRESVRISLAGSNVQAECVVPDDLWTVEVDERQIGQVIQGVALNAKEAMPGGGTVFVRAENLTLDSSRESSLPIGRYVRLSITDKGVGIPREALPKIFEPYFSTKTRDTHKGMGLSLTICHAIMQRHKGAITVESEVGEGATFRLFFPVSPDT